MKKIIIALGLIAVAVTGYFMYKELKPKTYEVIFVIDNDVVGEAPETKKYKEGDTYTFPFSPFYKEGYEFSAWIVNEQLYTPGEKYTIENSDVTITIKWTKKSTTPITYEIKFILDDDVIGFAPITLALKTGDPFVLPANSFVKPGYTFVSWLIDGVEYAPNDTIIIETKDIDIYIKWILGNPLGF